MGDLRAVVLAAGLGKRMGSGKPKVLVEVAGRPLLHWVLDGLRRLHVRPIVVVEGPSSPRLSETFSGGDLDFVTQEERLGTGHALLQAETCLKGGTSAILVVHGDMPLVRDASLRDLARQRERLGCEAALLVAEATGTLYQGLGRAFVDASGHVERIVEARDLAVEPLRDAGQSLVNVGAYLFGEELSAGSLWEALRQVGRDNAQGEHYLPDVIGILRSMGHRTAAVVASDATEALGVNTPEELRSVEAELLRRQEMGR